MKSFARVVSCGVFALLVTAAQAFGQTTADEAQLKALMPFSQMAKQVPGLTRAQYERAIRVMAASGNRIAAAPRQTVPPPTYLGQLEGNPYSPASTANPYGPYGSPYAPASTKNPYGSYGSPYSPTSATNPYAITTPNLIGADGTYLGKLSANPYDPKSVSNPYGTYGSPYSPTSINNPYGVYGSPYSPMSPNNPYATAPPKIVAPSPFVLMPLLPIIKK